MYRIMEVLILLFDLRELARGLPARVQVRVEVEVRASRLRAMPHLLNSAPIWKTQA